MSLPLLSFTADNVSVQKYIRKLTSELESNDHVQLYYDEINDAILTYPGNGQFQHPGAEYVQPIVALEFYNNKLYVHHTDKPPDIYLIDNLENKLATIVNKILKKRK